jgi:hypothetical protein
VNPGCQKQKPFLLLTPRNVVRRGFANRLIIIVEACSSFASTWFSVHSHLEKYRLDGSS